MKVGIPKEIKNNENRVALTPAGAQAMINRGHTVYVQRSAGLGSGFGDDLYQAVGATLLDSIEEVYAIAEMIIKVKEPIASEYDLIRKNQLVFTYFHFASSLALTEAMIKSKATCLSYETVQLEDGSLPLLIPMSEVAGRMSIQEGAKYLEKPFGGKGVLLGGVPGVEKANVIIIGGGIVGTHAAKMAAGLGANVSILDINLDRLRDLDDMMPANVTTVFSDQYNLTRLIKSADLIVGAVLVPGAKAPKLITKDMLSLMEPGTVLVDVAVDQGGCIETCKPTTHQNPTYEVDGILHYCVANMPGAVPRTSTVALTNATLKYAINLADHGWEKACKNDHSLSKGLNIVDGKVVYKAVAEAFDLVYDPLY